MQPSPWPPLIFSEVVPQNNYHFYSSKESQALHKWQQAPSYNLPGIRVTATFELHFVNRKLAWENIHAGVFPLCPWVSDSQRRGLFPRTQVKWVHLSENTYEFTCCCVSSHFHATSSRPPWKGVSCQLGTKTRLVINPSQGLRTSPNVLWHQRKEARSQVTTEGTIYWVLPGGGSVPSNTNARRVAETWVRKRNFLPLANTRVSYISGASALWKGPILHSNDSVYSSLLSNYGKTINSYSWQSWLWFKITAVMSSWDCTVRDMLKDLTWGVEGPCSYGCCPRMIAILCL